MDVLLALLASLLMASLAVLATFLFFSFLMNTVVFALLKRGMGRHLFCSSGNHYCYNSLGALGVARFATSKCQFCGERRKKADTGFKFRSGKKESRGNLVIVDFKKNKNNT
jgi:hypothetical protein